MGEQVFTIEMWDFIFQVLLYTWHAYAEAEQIVKMLITTSDHVTRSYAHTLTRSHAHTLTHSHALASRLLWGS